MAAATANLSRPDTSFRYDANTVDWRDFITPGCYYRLLSVDVAAGHADMLVKFDAGGECMYHRHVADVSTLVLEGELRVREQLDGREVLKVKPAGSYSIGGVGEVHIEGGGDQPAIIFFSMRTATDVIYELLNSDLSLRKAITVADFARDWHEKWPQDHR